MITKSPFSIQVVEDRDSLLGEAIERLKFSKTMLGSGDNEKRTSQTSSRSSGVDLFEKLNNEQILFSPKLDVQSIKKADFEKKGIELPIALKQKMGDHAFFRVIVPITLFPSSGWAFTRLESWLRLCPTEESSKKMVTIHDLFPNDIWTDVLKFQDGMRLGLDNHLNFKLTIDKIKGKIDAFDVAAEIQAKNEVGLSASLVVGPFNYHLKRSDVRARGKGNVECFWRMDGKDHVDQEDIHLDIIITVPKIRKEPVDLIGQARARHEFQPFLADVIKDWPRYFHQRMQSLFESGAPVTKSMEWANITGD
jgi:hypothetical protein